MNAATQHPPAGNTRLVGILTTIVAVGLPTAGILTANARDVEVTPGIGDWVFVGLVAAVSIATFAALVPWIMRGTPRRTTRAAIVLSVSALLLDTIFFWTMVPLAFGSAGAWLGYLGRERADDSLRGGVATTAIVLGTIAALASVAGYVATS